jgi:hypothetical protein
MSLHVAFHGAILNDASNALEARCIPWKQCTLLLRRLRLPE